MKKILLLCAMMSYSGLVMAQTTTDRVMVGDLLKDSEFDEELFSFLNMKIFHDRQVMQNGILAIYGVQASEEEQQDKVTAGVLSENDSNILEKAMDDKQLKYKITPELMKKAEKDPFGAFKDLVKNASVAKITEDEMSELGKVDEKAIPQMMQMMTESGPDFGARRVSVVYDETQN